MQRMEFFKQAIIVFSLDATPSRTAMKQAIGFRFFNPFSWFGVRPSGRSGRADELVDACSNGDVDRALAICQKLASGEVDRASVPGSTALRAAVKAGSAECVDLLLGFGASVGAATAAPDPCWTRNPEHGRTALHLAASLGFPDCLRLLLDREPPSSQDLVDELFWTAAGSRDAGCMTALPAPSSPNVSRHGMPALFHAAEAGSPQCVRHLLGMGADPNILGIAHPNRLLPSGHRANYAGHNALAAAAYCDSVEVLELLIQAGTDPFLLDFKGLMAIDYAACNPRRGHAMAERLAFRMALDPRAPAAFERFNDGHGAKFVGLTDRMAREAEAALLLAECGPSPEGIEPSIRARGSLRV
jgi:ankyrin repeat protein